MALAVGGGADSLEVLYNSLRKGPGVRSERGLGKFIFNSAEDWEKYK